MEEWRDVVGYEGMYQVSSEGRVKSLSRTSLSGHVLKERILKPSNTRGYLMANLTKDGCEKKFLIHRLVAVAFIPNPNGKPEINHLNEIKGDNRVDNLEWCTRSENINHGTGNQRRVANTDYKKRNQHPNWIKAHENIDYSYRYKPVIQFDKNWNMIRKWHKLAAVSEMGFDPTNVSRVCKNKKGLAHGYRWRWEKEEV